MRTPSDTRPPFTGTHGRFAILSETPCWVYHTMDSGSLDGNLPETATSTPAETDPVVTQGRANFNALTHGGLFSLLAQYRKAIVVDGIDNPGSSTVTIVNSGTGTSRTMPTSFPFTIAPGETLKAVGGSKVGFLVREDLPYR